MSAAGSIRRRLLTWLVLATALIGALALIDTRAEAIRTAQGVSDRILAGSALAIAERVTLDAEAGLDVDIPFSALEMLSSTAQDRVFYRVDGPEGLLTGYDDLQVVEGVRPGGIGFADLEMRGIRVRTATLVRVLSTGQGPVQFAVTVAESTRAREALAQAILARSAARIALLIAAAAGVAWVATTWALRPLGRLGQAIEARAPNDLSPVGAETPAEVAPLVGAINGFMARLDSAMAALKTFSGNANHQIRTPLTTARTQLALAARAPDPAEALDKADAALVRAERVLAQLLLLARVEAAGTRPVLERVDLAAEAREITREMIPEAAAAGCDLGFEGGGSLWAAAEPVLLGELLRNLIGNALGHAGPCEVTVEVGAEAGRPALAVEDSGPPLPPARLAAIARVLEGQPAEDGLRAGSHGLGLLIVRDIARALGGEVAAFPGRDGRGLRVQVVLRAA